jgi:hypothetical protein
MPDEAPVTSAVDVGDGSGSAIARRVPVASRAFQTGIAYGSSSSVLIAASFSTPPASAESIVKSIADVLGAIAWPLVAAGLLLFLFFSRHGQQLLSKIGRVKVGQIEVALTADTAPRVKAGLEDALATYRRDVKREFDVAIQVHNLAERRDTVAREVISKLARTTEPRRSSPLGLATPPSFRCTVYAPDVLIADSLYCVLNYWPTADRPAGAAFSVRYGIIGKCWRRETSDAAVPRDEDELIREWGMTRNEASQRAAEPKSFLAILLSHDEHAVGVLYADGPPGTFQEEDLETVAAAPEAARLAEALDNVLKRVANVQPRVHVFAR